MSVYISNSLGLLYHLQFALVPIARYNTLIDSIAGL